MFLYKIHRKFYVIILSIILITHQQNNPLFLENFSFEPYQSYMVVCFTSCCIGAFLYACIQNYCYRKPKIIPTENNKNISIDGLKQLEKKIDNTQTRVEAIEKNEKRTIKLLVEHNEHMNKLINLHQNNVQTRIAELTAKIKLIRLKEKEFLDLSQELKKEHVPLPIAITLYWIGQCKEKIEENKPRTTLLLTDQSAEQ